VIRQDVFAGIDGKVKEVFCAPQRPRFPKTKRSSCFQNTELEVSLTEVEGQRLANDQQLIAKQRLMNEEKKLNLDQRNQLAGEVAEFISEAENVRTRSGSFVKSSRKNWT